MLEQAGFTVERQMLEPAVYNRKVRLTKLDQPAEHQGWDIALTSWNDSVNFAVLRPYHEFAVSGLQDWVLEEPELQRLYGQVSRTVDREQQQALIRQMEWHTRDEAYFLFLYNPIKLYAVNKAVDFVPYFRMPLNLAETSMTEQHWSVRQAASNERSGGIPRLTRRTRVYETPLQMPFEAVEIMMLELRVSAVYEGIVS
jgi:ABC-type transport system substrate-binding protein